MKAGGKHETSADFQWIAQLYIPEDRTLCKEAGLLLLGDLMKTMVCCSLGKLFAEQAPTLL
jgi:hypothetical protein